MLTIALRGPSYPAHEDAEHQATCLLERLEGRVLLSGNGDRDLTVETYNVYVGADVAGPLASIISGNLNAIVGSVTAFWQTVLSTDIESRAKAIAKQIDATDPALVGLQEVASFFSDPFNPAVKSQTPLANFEEEILDALAARGLHYAPVARVTNADVEFPGFINGDAALDDLRLVDHDVILARTDLKTSELKLSNPQAENYATNVTFPSPFGTSTILRGWASIDAKVRGKTVRFINTHLDPDSEFVQRAQAAEILAGPADTALPVILAGDLNTRADGTSTATYGDLTDAGFVDAWTEVHPSKPGYTALQDDLLRNPTSQLSERIDFILMRGDLEARSAEVIGEAPSDRTPSGLWPSDHAGVVATVSVHARPNKSGHGWDRDARGDDPKKADKSLFDELYA